MRLLIGVCFNQLEPTASEISTIRQSDQIAVTFRIICMWIEMYIKDMLKSDMSAECLHLQVLGPYLHGNILDYYGLDRHRVG